jgi:hypothetical protein
MMNLINKIIWVIKIKKNNKKIKLYMLSYYSDQWTVLNYSGKHTKMDKNRAYSINYCAGRMRISIT